MSELASAVSRRGIAVRTLVVRSYLTGLVLDAEGKEVQRIGLIGMLRFLRSADVIHVHQLNSIGADLSLVSRLLLGPPVVLTDHGGGMRAAGRALGRWRLHGFAAAAYVSEWSRVDIDPRGVIKHFSLVYGGGDHLPAALTVGETYDVLYVGRLLPHKGAHLLVDALPPNVSALIVGEHRDAEYADVVRKASLGKPIRFEQEASDDAVAKAMAGAGVLVVPSVASYRGQRYKRPELLGLVALEALARGLPVIGSDVGGLGETLRFGGQEVVPEGDLLKLRAAIVAAVGGGRRSAVVETDRFAWSAVADRVAAIYGAALARRVREIRCVGD